MPRGLIPFLLLPLLIHLLFLLLLLTATTTEGLKVGQGGLESCNSGDDSFDDDILCDPDHLLSPMEGYNICRLLEKCGEKAGHVRVVVVLAANFTSDADKVKSKHNLKPTRITTTARSRRSAPAADTNSTSITFPSTDETRQGGDDEDVNSNINLLKELVVASNQLNTTRTTTTTTKNDNASTPATYTSSPSSSSRVILVVAIEDPFQLATWHSAELDGVLTKAMLEEAEGMAGRPEDRRNFTSAVVHVAHRLCQSVPRSKSERLTNIVLTVTWIAFTAAFVILLVVIVMALLRAHHRSSAARGVAVQEQGRRASRRLFPITSTSDTQYLSVMFTKASSNILLATTDITAVPSPQDCSSTDNLLQG